MNNDIIYSNLQPIPGEPKYKEFDENTNTLESLEKPADSVMLLL